MSFQKAYFQSKLLHQLCSLHGKNTGEVRTERSYQVAMELKYLLKCVELVHSFLVHKFRRNFNN